MGLIVREHCTGNHIFFTNTYSSSNGTGGTDGGLVGVASKLQGAVSGVSHPNLNRQILYNATLKIFCVELDPIFY